MFHAYEGRSSRTGWLGCMLLMCFMVLSGCSTVQELIGAADKPTARIKAVRMSDLSIDQVKLDFDVEIDNPYGVSLPLTDLTYTLSSGGSEFLAGEAPISGSIPSMSSRTVTVPADVTFVQLLRAVSGVRPGAVVPYDARLELSVDAPAVGPLTLPLRQSGEVPVPAVPTIKLESVDWQSLSFSDATAQLKIRVGNINQFPVDLSAMEYALSFAGRKVISTSVTQAVSFEAGDETVLAVPISLSPRSLGLAVFQILSGDSAAYQLGGTMHFSTPFGAIDFPFDSDGTTVFEH